jgi:hypothetical protein
MIFDPCCASASLRFTVSRMMVSSPIIPCGPSSSTRAPFDHRSASIPRPYLKSFLTAAGGGTLGGTASTIMSITIRASTRFWASLVAALGSDSEGHALNVRAGDVASPGCALQLLASKSPPLGTSVWKPPTTNFLGAAADASKYRRPVSPARSFPPGEDRLRVGGLYLLRVAGMVESHKHFMTFVRGTADRVAHDDDTEANRKNPLHVYAEVDAVLGQGKRQEPVAPYRAQRSMPTPSCRQAKAQEIFWQGCTLSPDVQDDGFVPSD